MKTEPFKASDYLGDKADVTALVNYAADLEAENERLRAALNKVRALIDFKEPPWRDLVQIEQAITRAQNIIDEL